MFFESFQRSDIDNLEWRQKSKVLDLARKKSDLFKNPDYIHPTYVLIGLCFSIPLIMLFTELHYQYAVTAFIMMGWISTYLTNKLSKPYIRPFLDEALEECNQSTIDKSNK